MSDKTLENDNRASTLINASGCYTRFEDVYCITNNKTSKEAMSSMFEVSYLNYSNEYTSALQIEDIDNYKDNNAYRDPIFNKNLTMVRFPFKDNSKPDIVRFFRYYPGNIVKDFYPELKEECNILEKDNLTFNEALFILLGFNYTLTPDTEDYSINTSNHLIDKKLMDQSPGQDLKSFFADQEYKPTEVFLKWSEKLNFITTLTDIKISDEEVKKLNQRPSTIRNQKLITFKVKEVLKDNPQLTRQPLADDISEWLFKKYEILLKPSAIERDYLKNYQELKQEAKEKAKLNPLIPS